MEDERFGEGVEARGALFAKKPASHGRDERRRRVEYCARAEVA
jgi:hypothetical protein